MNLNSAKYVGYIDIETIVLEKSDILLECNHSSEELGSSKRLKDDKGINGKKLTYVEALQVNKVERMVLVEIIYGGLPIHSCRE